MSTAAPLQTLAAQPKALSGSTHAGLLLQRKCACGSPTASLTGECAECKSRKRLQTKLAIGASSDLLEQEADQVADQVLAAPAHSAVRGASPCIQRYSAQATEGTDTTPASVNRVLASSGRPLEPTLRQDMEQRFGHNFSRVRVHSGGAAEQSAREANADAYTAGHNIKFGAGRFPPGTRRLIADDLTHVVPQSGPDGVRVAQGGEKRGLPSITRQSKQNSQTSQTMVEHYRESFAASIRRADHTRPSAVRGYLAAGERTVIKPGVAARYHDAMSGSEETSVMDLAALLAQTEVTPIGSIPELQEGQTVRLPDIVFKQTTVETDVIASTLGYAPTVTQSGSAPPPFGETSPYTFTMSGITVTSAAGAFTVTATVDNPITFQVAAGGNTDISSDSDADITQANYGTVASDLTPDMSDLNGRPPRTQFWAEDLCIRHERFHGTDGIGHARSGVTLTQNWLNTQIAASVADVNTLIGQIPARVIATRSAAMTYPGREERAYGDGAPSYLARATAIKTKGDAGGYGATGSAPPGLSRGAKTAIGVGGGALVGAGIGAFGGPVGAAVGAGVGALVGGIGSLFF